MCPSLLPVHETPGASNDSNPTRRGGDARRNAWQQNLTSRSGAMNFLSNLPGPHDIPFAAPLWAGLIVGSIIGFIVFKLLDLFIENED
jgi:hypothetical protein